MESGPVIIGAHSILSSTDPEADRAFLRDVLRLPHVDAGEGWLIFGLPPAEVAVHPSGKNNVHEFYLICDDVESFVAEMKELGVACEAVQSLGWGRLTRVTLPGGGTLGVYEPRHARPKSMAARGSAGKPARRTTGRRPRTSKRSPGSRKAKSRRF